MTKELVVSPMVKTLRRARELIERGWCQGEYNTHNHLDGTVSYCAVGALRSAARDGEVSWVVAACRLAQGIDGPASQIPVWNDQPGRTKEEVLAAFDRAIALEMGIPQVS